jgi:putative ABC transport system ATP-binding protein
VTAKGNIMPKEVLLRMSSVTKRFIAGSDVYALNNINLSIAKGDYLSIEGPSGGGKSTLLSLLGLLDKPSSGDYHISGIDVGTLSSKKMAAVRNNEIGFIFQDFNLIGDMTVYENVELPLIYRGVNKQQRKIMVEEVLIKVNMFERSQHKPTELSGGQQQRVAVARAIIGKPSLLLADEPTGNLDSKNGDAVMQLLQDLNSEGVTVCIVTHDSRYSDYANNIVHLFDGEIVIPSAELMNPTIMAIAEA